jgi:hypothetical protein
MSFTTQVVSAPDRDAVYVEIWFNETMVAEVYRSDENKLEICIYPVEGGKPWNFDLKYWLNALGDAEKELAGSLG